VILSTFDERQEKPIFLRLLLARGAFRAHCPLMIFKQTTDVISLRRFSALSMLGSLVILACIWASPAFGQNLIRVPADTGSVQDAIARVADGGTVELATGTYTAPNGGFTNVAGKAVTVQAAAGASVIISGGGSHDMLRITNAKRDQGKPMTFIGIRFSDGVTGQNFLGGCAILGEAEVIFKGCSFLNNKTSGNATAGGAFFIASSVVSFQGCVFIGNTSPNGGGAISALDSRIYVTNCQFTGNRSDMPGHSPNAPGGAIYSYNCQVEISSSVFEDNHAGYVGGAVYGAAPWDTTEKLVEIKNSLFNGNGAQKDPSVSFSAPAVGGAVHVEENITLNIYGCNFINNVSTQAGAISTYRSVASVDHCFFRGNKALATGTNGEGTGGAILALSNDGPGDPNRRSITLNVTDSLFMGANDGTPDAKEGGQIFVGGDPGRAYGTLGLSQDGTPESNRAQLKLLRVTFYKSRVDSSNAVPARASGAMGDFAHIEADNVLFLEGGAGSGSAALQAVDDSVVHLRQCIFQKNSANSFAAAITDFGGELTVNDSSFLDNFYAPSNSGKGVDITSSPNAGGSGGAGTNMTGLVTNCLFSGATTGGRIYDGAGTDKPPYNLLQYSANQFLPSNDAYVSDILLNTDVPGLNNFTVRFADGSTLKKAPVPNTVLSTLPASGQILAYSIKAPIVGGNGAVTTSNYVAFSATGNCVIDGVSQGSDGVITSPAGAHTLVVGGQTYVTTPDKNVAVNISTRLQVGTGTNVLIGGFIITGTAPKRIALRGIGPSLALAGVTGVLADPVIELHDQTGALIAQNDNWSSSADLRTDIVGVGLAPADPHESALIATLTPGQYTVVLKGAGDTTGVGLIEIYDLDGSKVSKLANISTRGQVAGGDQVMIGGFIVQGGNGPTNVVLRAIGPSLQKAGVAGALTDTLLEVHDGNGALISSNDDWRQGPDTAFISGNSLQPGDDRESALLLSTPAEGNYTAIVKGKNGAVGVCVVEAYVF
jgi:predicted outer membrane repeat protein